MPSGLRVRALLSPGGAAEVRERAQGVRREQRDQAAERAASAPARGRRELAGLRGRGARQGPGLRLRRRHFRSPAPGPPPPEGAGRGARRAPPLRLRRCRDPHRAARQRRAKALRGNAEPRPARRRQHVQRPEARWHRAAAAASWLLLHAEQQRCYE
ncbi:hypothetical protein PR202_ga23344 [Eleusine coracana subsp. coracana]|uniref:Uncharacterized protein n=1 Tax=Eleusine coracana subsp. coracana TaxID=191504 RepID=A0AAV5D632_ELECO|nr:hypothetical protein PR202_ga23344 [Eleusine coracana subsp. coracana]